MPDLKSLYKEARLEYKKRYITYLKRYIADNSDMYSHGHAMECSYVLRNLFGLTDKEMRELERNNYAGLLEVDLE